MVAQLFKFVKGMELNPENGGILPEPSISAEPGPVIPQGQPVTIVCRGPAWADLFRLEDEKRSVLGDQIMVPLRGSNGTEARFHISAVKSTLGSYFCFYLKGSSWSEPSEILEVTLAYEDVSTPPSGLSTEHLYILVGICVAFLLCLLILALLLVHCWRQKKGGTPSSKDEEPRLQERLSPTVDLTESSADVATTVDALPEANGDMDSPKEDETCMPVTGRIESPGPGNTVTLDSLYVPPHVPPSQILLISLHVSSHVLTCTHFPAGDCVPNLSSFTHPSTEAIGVSRGFSLPPLPCLSCR
ncbi:leukocyte-associated immunoglobulin-like receptor 1 [Phyllostomus hastatus]|uniref:leukocyte-associated immunoglobulin-like receptor 1 n=1 Tax=Phyllostomus hastatus TaxID=9423 RepID=UPI001E6839FF|nr:leukocyte-associated immunoglobulin-like receptor 1 [Phyllostomus hastatus]